MKYAEARTRENEKIGKSAAKLRTGEGSTIIRKRSSETSDRQWDEDMI